MTSTPPELKTILLVEDDSAHAELVVRTLEGAGERRIVHLSDGEAALAYLTRQDEYSEPESSPRPDLVLLDLRLPKVDGLEVLREIKSRPQLRQVPVLVLTTSDAARDVANAYEAHANGYVVKPDEFSRFKDMMDDVATFWLHWNHSPPDGMVVDG